VGVVQTRQDSSSCRRCLHSGVSVAYVRAVWWMLDVCVPGSRPRKLCFGAQPAAVPHEQHRVVAIPLTVAVPLAPGGVAAERARW
jgi:hypothetical protein